LIEQLEILNVQDPYPKELLNCLQDLTFLDNYEKTQQETQQKLLRTECVEELVKNGIIKQNAMQIVGKISHFPPSELPVDVKNLIIEEIRPLIDDKWFQIVIRSLNLDSNTQMIFNDANELIGACKTMDLTKYEYILQLKTVHEHLEEKELFARESYVKLFPLAIENASKASCALIGDPGIGKVDCIIMY
jgi:hypothetical protein